MPSYPLLPCTVESCRQHSLAFSSLPLCCRFPPPALSVSLDSVSDSYFRSLTRTIETRCLIGPHLPRRYNFNRLNDVCDVCVAPTSGNLIRVSCSRHAESFDGSYDTSAFALDMGNNCIVGSEPRNLRSYDFVSNSA